MTSLIVKQTFETVKLQLMYKDYGVLGMSCHVVWQLHASGLEEPCASYSTVTISQHALLENVGVHAQVTWHGISSTVNQLWWGSSHPLPVPCTTWDCHCCCFRSVNIQQFVYHQEIIWSHDLLKMWPSSLVWLVGGKLLKTTVTIYHSVWCHIAGLNLVQQCQCLFHDSKAKRNEIMHVIDREVARTRH